MAFKFIVISTLLAIASAGYVHHGPAHFSSDSPTLVTKIANPSVDAVALTHQNVVRTPSGTISHHSKSIQTPYSSVHKEDTRINNNVYSPLEGKTVTYSAPEGSNVYTSHSAPKTVYNIQEGLNVYTSHSAPKMVYNVPQIHEEQNDHMGYSEHTVPAHVYTHSTPTAVVYRESGPSVHLNSEKSHLYTSAPAPTHTAPTTTVYHHEIPSTSATYGSGSADYHQEVSSNTENHNSHSTIFSHNNQLSSGAITTTTHHHEANPVYAAIYQHEVPSTATTTYNHGPAVTTYTDNGPSVSAYGSSQRVHYSPADMVSHMSFNGFGTQWGY